MLTDQEKLIVDQMSAKGYSTEDIRSHIGATRAGRTSSIAREESERRDARQTAASNKGFWQKAGEFLTSENAIDQLSRGFIHGPLADTAFGEFVLGTDVETARRFVPPPERKKLGGAMLQTGALLGDVALAPISLPAQMAAGAGAGYVYDVGGNLVEDEATFTPGAGTFFGAVVPPAIKGLGVGGSKAFGFAQDIGSGIGRKAAGETAENVAETVGKQVEGTVPSAVGQKARELGTIPSRIAGRVDESVTKAGERAVARQSLSEIGQSALDDGLTLDTVKFVDAFDEQTKAAAREMIKAAENPRGGVVAQDVPGAYIDNQFSNYLQPKLRSVGERIGELSDALPEQNVNMATAHRTLNDVLSQNRIRVKNGRLIFDNKNITPKQQKLLQELYTTVTTDKTLTPRQIHEFDSRISKEFREGLIGDNVSNIYVTYAAENGSKVTRPVDQVFRDVFRTELNTLSPEMRAANTEYAMYKGILDDVQDTYLKQSKRLNTTPDPEVTAGTALRRVFSNAQSRSEYQAIAEKLDLVSRQLGYEGPAPVDLTEFYLKDLKPLYPDSVQPASFEGGIMGSIRQTLGNILEAGKVTQTDQQRALKRLLNYGDETIPVTPAAESVEQATEKVLKEVEEDISALPPSVPDYLKNNPQAGFAAGDAREKALEQSLKKIEERMKQVPETSNSFKQLEKAREEIYKLMGKG